MNDFHTPVLIQEALEYLKVKKGSWYVDCTLGGGGHTEAILKKGGKVLGIDLDPDAILEVEKKYQKHIKQKNLKLFRDNFINLKMVVSDKVCGVLFDLGLSSHQLREGERGFSFNKDALLDMRMDPSLAVSAMDLVNGLHEGELSELFWKLGEEKYARKIAAKIVLARKFKKIETTKQLADLITSVKKKSVDRIHPATQVFQALRIAVNDELNNLKVVLPEALDVLEKGGRVVVISFHSLEDKIVKNFFREMEERGVAKIITKKPITPSQDEILINPRSRSSKLRVLEKR